MKIVVEERREKFGWGSDTGMTMAWKQRSGLIALILALVAGLLLPWGPLLRSGRCPLSVTASTV